MSDAEKASFTYTGRDNLEAMRHARHYNAFLQDLILSNAPSGGTWLDFGAGAGQFAIPLSQTGHNVVAVEVDRALASQIESSGVKTHADLADIADESIEYAYTLNVLEHISDDTQTLCLLRKKLKHGGKLLIYVPAFQILYSSMDVLVGHQRRYTKASLSAIVQSAGLSIQTARYADSIGFFASLAYKLAPSRDGVISSRSVALYDRWVFPLSRHLDKLIQRWLGKNVYLIAKK